MNNGTQKEIVVEKKLVFTHLWNPSRFRYLLKQLPCVHQLVFSIRYLTRNIYRLRRWNTNHAEKLYLTFRGYWYN